MSMEKTKRLRIYLILMLFGLVTGCMSSKSSVDKRGLLLDSDQIKVDTEYLCNDIGIRVQGSSEEDRTAGWIVERLGQYGFLESNRSLVNEVFAAPNGDSRNVFAIYGRDDQKPIISIMAHYDSVQTSPGARDNGASIAVLLQLAKKFSEEQPELAYEIRFLFLGAEENGYHGSAAYIKALSDEDKERHIAAFNMDISAATKGSDAVLTCNTLGKITNQEYEEGSIFEPAINQPAVCIKEAYEGLYGTDTVSVFHYGDSDHVSFHEAGIEAVNVCFRKIGDGMPVLPEEYHQMSDTPEDIDYDTANQVGSCIYQAVIEYKKNL